EGQVQVERAAAGLLRVQVDLPGLAQGVGLDEVPLVVHVEAVVDRVILELGHEPGDVDGGHVSQPATSDLVDPRGWPRPTIACSTSSTRRRPPCASSWTGWTTGGRAAGRPASTCATWRPTRRRSRGSTRAASACCPRSPACTGPTARRSSTSTRATAAPPPPAA